MAPPREPPKGERYTPPKQKIPPRPDVSVPPAQAKPGISEGAAFDRFMRAHPKLLPYADSIWRWAKQYGVPAIVLAALLWQESKGDQGARNPKSGALGLAQIQMDKYGKFGGWRGTTTKWGETIDDAFATNPDKSIRWAAWYLTELYQGDWDAAYGKYSGGAKVKLSSLYPKGYVPRSGGLSPSQAASTGAERQAARDALSDPWVMGTNKKGKLVLSFEDLPPKNVQILDGLPMRQSDFLRLKKAMEKTYIMFTGNRPTNLMILDLAKNGWSEYYLLDKVLSRMPGFKNSPIYKSGEAGGGLFYEAASKGLLAVGGKLDDETVRQAIVNQWDGQVFQAQLRKLPGYVKSTEFKGKAATMQIAYSDIYGRADGRALAMIARATVGGWDPDQFSTWLRSRDEYVFTGEYRDKAVRLIEALGMMTGDVPTLTPAAPPPDRVGKDTPLPSDPRLTAEAGLPTGPYLIGGTRG